MGDHWLMEAESRQMILIIDDEEEIARIIAHLLNAEGYSTLIAHTGQMA
jgi:CheY-like chemotaxis protein